MRKSKKWWKSRTLWFNLVSGVVTGAAAIGDKLGPKETAVATAVAAIGNMILRAMTSEPIGG